MLQKFYYYFWPTSTKPVGTKTLRKWSNGLQRAMREPTSHWGLCLLSCQRGYVSPLCVCLSADNSKSCRQVLMTFLERWLLQQMIKCWWRSLRGRLMSSNPCYSGLRRQTAEGVVRGVAYRPRQWDHDVDRGIFNGIITIAGSRQSYCLFLWHWFMHLEQY